MVTKTKGTPNTSPDKIGAHPLNTRPDKIGAGTRLTLRELVSRFLRSRRGLSPKSQRYYRMCLDGLLYFAGLSGWPEDPALISRDHLHDFEYYLANEPHRWAGDGRRCTFKKATDGTVHHYLKVAKTLFNWACDEDGCLQISPIQHLKLPNPHYNEVEPYTDDEVAAMLDVCEHDLQWGYRFLGARNKAIISVFIDTGLRLEELAGMKLSGLDPGLQQVRVLGKGAKFRVVPLNGQARRALKLYLTHYRQPGGDEVWQTDQGEPLKPAGIRMLIERIKRRAGVASGGGAHRLRHYFATRYLEGGGDMNSLRLLLGHSTLYMVLKYTQFQNVRRALDQHSAVSPLDRLLSGGPDKIGESGERWGWRQ